MYCIDVVAEILQSMASTFAVKFSSSKMLLDFMSRWHKGGSQYEWRYSCNGPVNTLIFIEG